LTAAPPVVHLIDGHVYVFRAYHSLPPMTSPDGAPTQAAYGFASTLLRYLGEARPTHLAVAFDHAMTSFRNASFAGYKASRGEPPPDLEAQFAMCDDVARACGVATFAVPDFEADDVLATLATACLARSARVVVVSGDKDLAQLVTEDGAVLLHDLARGETLDADEVRRRFGVSPHQIPDYLALVGDAVDDLPGVRGVGRKTAALLLARFESLDAIPLAAAPLREAGVRGAEAVAERLAEHRDQAFAVRELATLRRDVPGLPHTIDPLAWEGARRGEVDAAFSRLGFAAIRERVPRWRSPPAGGIPLRGGDSELR
jgi:5'-3' exonuclease